MPFHTVFIETITPDACLDPNLIASLCTFFTQLELLITNIHVCVCRTGDLGMMDVPAPLMFLFEKFMYKTILKVVGHV